MSIASDHVRSGMGYLAPTRVFVLLSDGNCRTNRGRWLLEQITTGKSASVRRSWEVLSFCGLKALHFHLHNDGTRVER